MALSLFLKAEGKNTRQAVGAKIRGLRGGQVVKPGRYSEDPGGLRPPWGKGGPRPPRRRRRRRREKQRRRSVEWEAGGGGCSGAGGGSVGDAHHSEGG